jgi:molybdopterin-guanine dinucleotide biosynthesis protein A
LEIARSQEQRSVRGIFPVRAALASFAAPSIKMSEVMGVTLNVSGFVLAGGESRRMGQDKTLLKLAGVPILLRATQLVESVVGSAIVIGRRFANQQSGQSPDQSPSQSIAQPPDHHSALRIVPDDFPGAGPLGGIATALCTTSTTWSLIVACDLPYLTKPWLEYLVSRAFAAPADVDAVLPMNATRAEPLCAMYHKRSEAAIRLALESGIRKVTDVLAGIRVEPIEASQWREFDREGSLFKNMNSPADYEEAKAKLG